MTDGVPVDPSTVTSLLDQPLNSPQITDYISSLASTSTAPPSSTKAYSDATYCNYYSLGITLCYLPTTSERTLAYIDVYNPPPDRTANRRQKDPWDGYSSPTLPITFRFNSTTVSIPGQKSSDPPTTISRPDSFIVGMKTTGRDFVACLGEPNKKGGGQNPNIPPFLEWENVEILNAQGQTVVIGVMVELRDPGAQESLTPEQMKRGAGGLWDRAAGWTWVGLKLFKAGTQTS